MTSITELPRVSFDEDQVGDLDSGTGNIGAWVVSVGSPYSGITLYGPFDSLEEAQTWHDDSGFAEDSPFDDGPTEIIPVYKRFPA